MNFYSTKNPGTNYSLKEAVLQGLPDDNGLFMPDHLQVMPDSFYHSIEQLSFIEIANAVGQVILKDSLEPAILNQIVTEVFDFEVPVNLVAKDIYCLELFHGPTLAFKDFGARFMARLLAHLLDDEDGRPCILVATSGDTGSAVAQGFYQVPGIDVVILYPSGKVSEIQEKQLTTIGGNVTALEIDGNFDDCQRLVKSAFLDQDLKSNRRLTSANSINIARLIPQSFYYFQVFARLKHLNKPIICSVPSGNFGNLMGGLLAKRMGLPIHQFIAANNANRVFYDYLQTGEFQAKPSVATISNAMDVGNPSNFERVMDLYNNDWESLAELVKGYTFNDSETRKAISRVYQESGYLMDPHGAVAYLGLGESLKDNPNTVGVFLGTAHPAKFFEVVKPLIPDEVEIPERLESIISRQKQSIKLSSDYRELKQYLLSK
ncbi:MAG: threonine synthase [Cyclobacteriaceae bacterium]|nr:MAG: threonine synthase [Cyclobacteriaceae bacterium]